MATKQRLRRPSTVVDAAEKLDLQPRQGRLLAAQGLFGKLRPPTKAERLKFGFSVNSRIVVDMGVVWRLKVAREKLGALAALKAARKARRRR